MATLHPMSDLHLDMSKQSPILPGGDVLILAGDTAEVKGIVAIPTERLAAMGEDPSQWSNKERIARFFLDECSKYKHVIMIAGNHESYHSNISKTHGRLRGNTPSNFTILDKENVIIDGIMYIGATLWSDCNKANSLTMQLLRHSMNDFDVIRRTHPNGENVRWTPHDAVVEHRATLAYLKTTLKEAEDAGLPVVVITHHAPSALSLDDRYTDDFHMNGGYYSDLSELILDNPHIKVWIHGHMHQVKDYMIGSTRVVCNPRGYQTARFNEETGFNVNISIEV